MSAKKQEEKALTVTMPQNALEIMAGRLNVSRDQLEQTLKATILKSVKVGDTTRPATDAEFISFVAVANAYKLNPFTKEIYAFPDTKGGGIIPIVSTDGWTKLMTTHPDYKSHRFEYCEDTKEMPQAKECPEWMEIHIQKKDGSTVIIREYLDECFRKLNYSNPWQTHTKRMLRHKTKIQGAREAFGFAGIYDRDEGERIYEAEVVSISKTDTVEEDDTGSDGPAAIGHEAEQQPASEQTAETKQSQGGEAESHVKETLITELNNYVADDDKKFKSMLKDLTAFDDNKGTNDITKVSDKWAGSTLKKLREKVKAEAPEGCTLDDRTCDHSQYETGNPFAFCKANKGRRCQFQKGTSLS